MHGLLGKAAGALILVLGLSGCGAKDAPLIHPLCKEDPEAACQNSAKEPSSFSREVL